MTVRIAESVATLVSTGAKRELRCALGSAGAGIACNAAIVVSLGARMTERTSSSVPVLTGHRSWPHANAPAVERKNAARAAANVARIAPPRILFSIPICSRLITNGPASGIARQQVLLHHAEDPPIPGVIKYEHPIKHPLRPRLDLDAELRH